MSGRVQLEVSNGLDQILAHPWIRDHLEELVRPDGSRAAGYLSLVSVHDVDTTGLIAAAPDAAWQAYCGLDTDTPNLWLGYHPSTGLLEADHVDGVLLVPLTSAAPDLRTPAADAHLRRLTTLVDLLDASWAGTRPTSIDQTAVDPLTGRDRRRGTRWHRCPTTYGTHPVTPMEPPHTHAATAADAPGSDSPMTSRLLATLADLDVTSHRGPEWAADDVEDALWGPGVIGWDDTHPDAGPIAAAIHAAADELVDRVTALLPTGLHLIDDQVWGPRRHRRQGIGPRGTPVEGTRLVRRDRRRERTVGAP